MSKQFSGMMLNAQKFDEHADRQGKKMVWHNPRITRLDLKRTLSGTGLYDDGENEAGTFDIG